MGLHWPSLLYTCIPEPRLQIIWACFHGATKISPLRPKADQVLGLGQPDGVSIFIDER